LLCTNENPSGSIHRGNASKVNKPVSLIFFPEFADDRWNQ